MRAITSASALTAWRWSGTVRFPRWIKDEEVPSEAGHTESPLT
ncbi:hypothetical protein Pint_17311 [Pistacia integerrima]|uniref:Uncharacterized protein n=1 Tax=Pistacia integerrima TaxID=434235 RepID=A0ACC0YZ04_9ROSI|nr:hypothetical protein Pint_17311 [Pistacia integerrima]